MPVEVAGTIWIFFSFPDAGWDGSTVSTTNTSVSNVTEIVLSVILMPSPATRFDCLVDTSSLIAPTISLDAVVNVSSEAFCFSADKSLIAPTTVLSVKL